MVRSFQLSLVVTIIVLAACTQTVHQDARPTISVSILPQKYLTERIAGDNFKINVLVPSGSSAETYEPTPRQMQDAANSVLYFRIGYLEFERTLVRNIQAQNTNLRFVNTSEGINLIAAEIADHGDHVHLYGVDPHTWITVTGVRMQAENMLEAIIDADPDNKEQYLENYNIFIEELDQLHAELKKKFSDVKRRAFIIFHPALGYFARDYGLTQISIEQEGKNPTAANMRQIIDIAREEGIRDVFIQMEFELDNALVVARELGGEVIEINPLSENWMDSMTEIADKLFEVLNKD